MPEVRALASSVLAMEARDALATDPGLLDQLEKRTGLARVALVEVLTVVDERAEGYPSDEAVSFALQVKVRQLTDMVIAETRQPEERGIRFAVACAYGDAHPESSQEDREEMANRVIARLNREGTAYSRLQEVARLAAQHLRRLPATSEREDVLIAELLEEAVDGR